LPKQKNQSAKATMETCHHTFVQTDAESIDSIQTEGKSTAKNPLTFRQNPVF
jgi:hypothetical protein